jgi:uncharacterized protein (UPF0276 family)
VALAGVGHKLIHARAQLEREPFEFLQGSGFLEVHAENYMVDGGPLLRHLERLRERWPLSVHGVGLSIGGAGPLDTEHLEKLARLLERFEPQWFSEHLAWCSHLGTWFNDLLPLPYDRETLDRVCDHVDQTQDRLGRRLLLENPSTYLSHSGSVMDEAAFISDVVRRTGCGLLLDINNVYVSAANHGRDAHQMVEAVLAGVPAAAVAEIHLAGFARDRDARGDPLLIDHHGAEIDAAVWALYELVIDRLGPVPTLIERDNNVPPLQLLEAEALRALGIQQSVSQQGGGGAAL